MNSFFRRNDLSGIFAAFTDDCLAKIFFRTVLSQIIDKSTCCYSTIKFLMLFGFAISHFTQKFRFAKLLREIQFLRAKTLFQREIVKCSIFEC